MSRNIKFNHYYYFLFRYIRNKFSSLKYAGKLTNIKILRKTMLLSKVIFNWNPLKISVSTTGFLKKKYLRPDWWKVHSVRQLHQTEIAYYAGVEENSSDYAKNSIILESLYGPVEIPQLNLPQFIWRNVDKWADKPMAVSVTQTLIIFLLL